MTDIDSRPLLRELVIARARFLQRLEPPSLYWKALGARTQLRNGFPSPRTQQAKILSKELEGYVDTYIRTVRRRYPAFEHDPLASYTEQ